MRDMTRKLKKEANILLLPGTLRPAANAYCSFKQRRWRRRCAADPDV